MLQLLNMCPNQVEAVLQRSMQRVNRFIRQIGKIVQGTQPVTFLSHATVTAAIPGGIEDAVMRTIPEPDFL